MAICRSIVGMLFPEISEMSFRWMPGFERTMVYVTINLSFNLSFNSSFNLSFASPFPLLGIGSTKATSSTSRLFYIGIA